MFLSKRIVFIKYISQNGVLLKVPFPYFAHFQLVQNFSKTNI